jgi:alpha-ketoglutarate-dependent taurine dioxygenase
MEISSSGKTLGATVKGIDLAQPLSDGDRERILPAPHHWAQGDVLMWDNVGTVHNAVADYGPDEPRYMRRVQVMATSA